MVHFFYDCGVRDRRSRIARVGPSATHPLYIQTSCVVFPLLHNLSHAISNGRYLRYLSGMYTFSVVPMVFPKGKLSWMLPSSSAARRNLFFEKPNSRPIMRRKWYGTLQVYPVRLGGRMENPTAVQTTTPKWRSNARSFASQISDCVSWKLVSRTISLCVGSRACMQLDGYRSVLSPNVS
jgi:hypothetical protein